jgi:hypothetical protein
MIQSQKGVIGIIAYHDFNERFTVVRQSNEPR